MLLLLVLLPHFRTSRKPNGLDLECRTESLVVEGAVALGAAAVIVASAKFQRL